MTMQNNRLANHLWAEMALFAAVAVILLALSAKYVW
jgi:hypothetical protein